MARVRGGPNQESARRLLEFLLSAEVEGMLAASGSAQLPLRPGVVGPKELPSLSRLRLLILSFEDAARGVVESEAFIRDLFLR